MTKQSITSIDVIGINMMIAHVRCISELIHNLPEHKYEFKAYFKELFKTVKKYEDALNKMTNYNKFDSAYLQQQEIYDDLMEVTYQIREIILQRQNENNGSGNTGTSN